MLHDSARNRERGHGTHSWLGSRQAVQSSGYMRDKPITTASVEMRLTEGARRQNAGSNVSCALVLAEVTVMDQSHYYLIILTFYKQCLPFLCILSFEPPIKLIFNERNLPLVCGILTVIFQMCN